MIKRIRILVSAAYRPDNFPLLVFLSVLAAMIVGGALIDLSSQEVTDAWGNAGSDLPGALRTSIAVPADAYYAMFKGSIVDPSSVQERRGLGAICYPLSETLVSATPLILTGLAVAVPFRAGLFNIGAQGQFIGGAVFAAYVGFAVDLPPVLHVLVAVIAGFVGGALLGGLVGWLRAVTGAHEVITTIMVNYVALLGLDYLLHTAAFQREGSGDPVSRLVSQNALLPHVPGGLRVHAGFAVAVVVAAAVGWLLRRTTTGFAMQAAGSNPAAARTAGMNVSWLLTLSMLVGGGLAGLAGAGEVLGTQYALTTGISGSFGFDAITVALLGRGRPRGILGAALLFGALQAGGVQMQAATATPWQLIGVIQALIVLFVAAPGILGFVFPKSTRSATLVATDGERALSTPVEVST